MQRLISSAIAAMLLGAASSAMAYDGFATGNVNLRAGPDIDYPVVTTIPVGAELSIQGCIDGWEWCDVIFAGMRGWVAGNYIQYEYNDRPVLLSGYGAAIGVPVVTFVIADYWGHYYRNRPFWVERERWYARPYVRRAPPVAIVGPVHDWGHDRAHTGYYDHGHSYSPHPEYHAAPHAEYHGATHQEYHATQQVSYGNPSYGHGYQQSQHSVDPHHGSMYAPVQQTHAAAQAAPQRHGDSHSNGDSSSHDHGHDHDHSH